MLRNDSNPECGIAGCKPTFLRRLANIKCFACSYSISGLMTASLSMYIVSQITTIERQFGLSSTKSGYLMACNDVGYAIFILFASYSARYVHIPRFLSISTMLYGISGIICAIPAFLYKPPPLPEQPTGMDVMTSPVTTGLCMPENGIRDTGQMSLNSSAGPPGMGPSDVDPSRSNVAMTFIAIGMIIQGIGKAPRSPMLAQFVDDNTNRQDTGMYMGAITAVAVLGPAIAYGLGGIFSQIYVTLEQVDLHPRDPRWIGAWWLGFLVFGVAAILCATPLLLFPSKVRGPFSSKSRTPRTRTVNCTLICREFAGVFKSISRVLRNQAFVCMLLSTIVYVISFGATMSFGPKYLEVQFNIPTYQTNYILAAFLLISICLGSLIGGYITKKINLTPRSCTLLILLPQFPSVLLGFVLMFLKCDQPQLHNWPSQSSLSLPASCSSDCACGPTFLPVCDGAGTNYFSPCHAGCSGGSLYKFTNCTCIPDGEVTTGLCQFDCNMLWPFLAVNLASLLMGAILMMPTFIFNIRIVENELKAMSVGIAALCMALFGFLPGPVIGGKLVDNACLLWSEHVDNEGSCKFYNIDTLRFNIIGFSIVCRSVSILFMAAILCFTWNMKSWPNKRDQMEENDTDIDKHSNKPDPLLMKESKA